MTYVFGGTLNLAQLMGRISLDICCICYVSVW